MNSEQLRQKLAEAALAYIGRESVIGVGSGRTIAYLIEALGTIKSRLEGAVASSEETARLLKLQGISVLDPNTLDSIPIYLDSADEADPHLHLIKGGGGALTREKILATMSKRFICLIDETKWVDRLGNFPIAIEVLPMARSYIARKIVQIGGFPSYRQGFITDNGNIILDVYHLDTTELTKLEESLKSLPGVVESGIFAKRPADTLLLATQKEILVKTRAGLS